MSCSVCVCVCVCVCVRERERLKYQLSYFAEFVVCSVVFFDIVFPQVGYGVRIVHPPVCACACVRACVCVFSVSICGISLT